MTRLYVVCEGLTEINFVERLLAPHFAAGCPEVMSVSASRPKKRFTYAEIRKFVRNLLGSSGSPVVVTTMVDLFKLPGDFPGSAEALNLAPIDSRAAAGSQLRAGYWRPPFSGVHSVA